MLPDIFTPEEVAKHFGWSPRKVRQLARKLGACSILGNRMVMRHEDVATLLEATKPPVAPKPVSSDVAAAWKALERAKVREKLGRGRSR